MIQGGARASEWFLPSSVGSTQVLGLKSCPAARLHNRNAAGPGYHSSPALRTQSQSDVRAPWVRKLGPERTWGTFPKALSARESLTLSPVAIARAWSRPIIFAVCSLNVKLLFV
jgi:hypothetical protein